MVAKSSPPIATTPAQPSNAAVPPTQSTPTAPLSETPKSPSPPKGLFEDPVYYSKPGQDDPRDATYWANLAKLRFSAEQSYAGNLHEQQMADTGYNDALQAAIRNRAVEQRSLGENAIRGNLGNSGWLDRNEAEQTTTYTQERSQGLLSKTQEDAAREATRKGIREGYSLDAAAELGEAAARLAARKEREAAEAEGREGAVDEGGEGGTRSKAWSGQAPKGKGAGTIRPRKPPPKRMNVASAKPAAPAKKQALQNRRKAR